MSKAPIKEMLFGRMAAGGRFVTEEQIAECLELQRRYEGRGGPVPRLGELLAMKGYMTAEQVRAVLEGQHGRREGLFGEIAARWRLVSRGDLDNALNVQRGMDVAGKHRARIGEILVQRGLLKPHHVRAILDAQGKRIVHCSGCNARFNIAQFRAGARLICSRCGATTVLGDSDRHVADHTPLDVENTVWLPEKAAGEAAGEALESTEAGPEEAAGAPLQIGGYEVLSRLGSDGTTLVCKARHLTTGNLVALKVMRGGTAADEQFLQRFLPESRESVYLEHPGLKRVYEVGEHQGRCFLAEEFIEGKSLKRQIELVGKLSPSEAVDFAAQIAEALEYGHAHGKVHGDVRPSNVVIDRSGRARLSGLGVAKDVMLNLRYFGRGAESTPFYLAPEAAIEPVELSSRSDVYSLGAVLYHMLTGRPPYSGRGSLEVFMRLAQENPVPPEQLDPELPAPLCKLVMAMLAAEPAERPQTMTEVLARLRKIGAELAPVKPRTQGLTSAGTAAISSTAAARLTTRERHALQTMGGHRLHERLHPRAGAGTAVRVIIGLALVIGAFVAVYAVRESDKDRPNSAYRPPPPRANPVQPAYDPALEAVAKAYGEAVNYAEANRGDDAVIAARFKAVLDRFPNAGGGYAQPCRERYQQHLVQAARRALEGLERARPALESRGDFKASLAAADEWLRQYADAGEEPLRRGRAVRGAVLGAQEQFLAARFKEADIQAAAGKFAEARDLIAGKSAGLSPEAAPLVNAKLKELDAREVATLSAEARERLEAERRKREEAALQRREGLARELHARSGRLFADVPELLAARNFETALTDLDAFLKDAASSEYEARAAELREAVALAAEFHRRMLAGIKAGQNEPKLRYDKRPRAVIAASVSEVTLGLNADMTVKLRWSIFSARDLCELARLYAPADDPGALEGYAVFASALGDDAEARRGLELAARLRPVNPAVRAAVEGRWLLSEAEKRRRQADSDRLAGQAESLRAVAAAFVANWEFARAAEELGRARVELIGTDHELRMAQAEEAVRAAGAFHEALVAALKARRNNPKARYLGKLRNVLDASAAGFTLDVEGSQARLTWSALNGRDLAELCSAQADPKDGAALVGCALFLALVGEEPAAREKLKEARAAGARTTAAAAAVDLRLLLTAEERKRREDEDRKLAGRFDELRGSVSALIAAGECDRALGALVSARGQLGSAEPEVRRAQMEESAVLLAAFHKGFVAALRKGVGQLRYMGQLRRVTQADGTGITVNLGEGAPIKLPWNTVSTREICDMYAAAVDQKDGASLLGYALMCSARGQDADARKNLERAEALGARSAGARATIEGKWLAPPPEPKANP